ncbi:GPP34 family phosphoprotein [Glutamicibacter sp. JC586]|uniref:GOLPH3/VPS74 family protein n=1 Tax=Glutamicibacter sp. JC586 TaxID=2590552 RepID=UPI001359EB0C|nr:GPP34 family phosphoprotein [Glutamicibacter sp. JC586]
MLISEKLYLLMADNQQKPEAVMAAAGYGMNAAVLSDLMIAGRIALSDDRPARIKLIGAGPCPDPVLASPLEKLEKKEGVSLDAAVKIPSLCDVRLVTDSLAKAGVVEYGARTLLGLGKERVNILNDQIERQIRADLGAELHGKKPAGISDTTVLAILQALGIAQEVLEQEISPMSEGQAKARIAELAQDSPTADSAQRAVAQVNSIITSEPVIPPATRTK